MRGARLLAGGGGLGRLIRRLNVMTVPDIVSWTKRDEFLLTTGYPLPRDLAAFRGLAEQLAGRGLAGLGIKLDQYLAEVPVGVIEFAEAAAFPVIAIPHRAPFDDVLSQAFETIVNRQAAALAKTQEIHDAFIGIALAGGGLEKLAEELSAILAGASVVICDGTGQVLAAAGEQDPICSLGFRYERGLLDTSRLADDGRFGNGGQEGLAVAVIRAGAMRHGFVLAASAGQPLPGLAGPAVEQAALVAALEITRHLAVLAVEQRFAANALHDLVTSPAAEVDDAVSRAASFRWNLRRPLAVLVARHDSGPGAGGQEDREQEPAVVRSVELWMSAVRARDPQAAVAGFATELVAVIGADEDPATLAGKVQADLAASRCACSIGVSQVGTRASDIPRLYEEARIALRIGRRLNGRDAVTSFAGLGLYRLISGVGQRDLQSFVRDSLGPVLDLPQPARDDLLRTLAVLLDTRLNIAESARLLHYHYNTMRYRFSKLERLLGSFSKDPQAALRLGVALQILRMHEISGGAHPAAGEPRPRQRLPRPG
jgi:purine catabolism regulator